MKIFLLTIYSDPVNAVIEKQIAAFDRKKLEDYAVHYITEGENKYLFSMNSTTPPLKPNDYCYVRMIDLLS